MSGPDRHITEAERQQIQNQYNTQMANIPRGAQAPWDTHAVQYGEQAAPKAQAASVSVKHDQGKPDLSMTSYELMEAIGRVREFGAKKYSRDNWKISGFKVTRSCAAALRHIFLFLSGETLDQESNLPHLAHAVCCLEHAIYDMKNHPENDDRYKKP